MIDLRSDYPLVVAVSVMWILLGIIGIVGLPTLAVLWVMAVVEDFRRWRAGR